MPNDPAATLSSKMVLSASNLKQALEGLGAVVPPITLLAALAFYFGLEFINSRSSYFGIDYSILGFSAQDYILRSTDALFVPLGAIAVVGLLFLQIHTLIAALVMRPGYWRAIRWTSRVLQLLGFVLFASAAVAVFRPLPFIRPFSLPAVRPLTLGLGIALLGYGTYLSMRQTSTSSQGQRVRQIPPTSRVLVGLLIFLSLFWAVSEYAQALGRGRAEGLAANLATRPGVIVYSKQRLLIDQDAPTVVETRIDSPDVVYHYRYTGLRLLVRSDGKFFLLPEQWSHVGGVAIVVPDDDSIRLEYTPGAP